MKNSLTGDEALTPEQSEAYHVALCQAHTIIREALAETREQKATRLIAESGTSIHYSDCATSIAPAEEPGPCDCVKDDEICTNCLHDRSDHSKEPPYKCTSGFYGDDPDEKDCLCVGFAAGRKESNVS